MEEEKQHEAGGQPATEELAEARPTPEVSPELRDASSESPEEGARGEESADGGVAGSLAAQSPEVDSVEADAPAELQDGADELAFSSSSDDEIVEDTFSEISVTDESGDERAGTDRLAADDEEEADSSAETSINAYELLGSTEDQATEAETDAATLKAVLEAIVYVLPEPVPAAQMAAALNQPVERVESILRELMEDTAKADRGVFVREVAGGYQVATKPEHHEAIRNFVKNLKQPLKLSGAALETLAVIAYKQPVTAPEIMEIRGVQGVGVLKTLLDRKLITTAGRKNVIGKPILYKTTKEFLTQFGLNRVSELPTLKEFDEIRRQSISDDEVGSEAEERPEADASAPLLQQAAEQEEAGAAAAFEEVSRNAASHASDAGGEAPSGSDQDAEPSGSEQDADPHAEPEPTAETDPHAEAPPEGEAGPESEEHHG